MIVQNYNSVLTLSRLYQLSDAILVHENDTVHKICSQLMNIKHISISDVNKVIAHQLASILQPAYTADSPCHYSTNPIGTNYSQFTSNFRQNGTPLPVFICCLQGNYWLLWCVTLSINCSACVTFLRCPARLWPIVRLIGLGCSSIYVKCSSPALGWRKVSAVMSHILVISGRMFYKWQLLLHWLSTLHNGFVELKHSFLKELTGQ